jgi:MFS transporter, SP family, sugar:H+ symporter
MGNYRGGATTTPPAPPDAPSEDPASAAAHGHREAIVLLTALVAAIGGFLFGFDSSVINGAVDAIQREYGLGSFLKGLVVAIALLGSALGAWYAGPIADRVGRTRAMTATAAIFAVSAIGSMLAFAVWELAFWRFVGGMAIGSASVLAPAYIAEISPPAIRGRLGSLQQLAIVLGIFVALLSDYALAQSAGGADQDLWLGLAAWRWMFVAAIVPALLYGLLALQIPESPRYLLAQHRDREARAVLRRFTGADVGATVEAIRRTLRDDHRVRLSDLRGRRLGLLPVVWVGILLSIFQQAVGINVIFYYSSTLWQSVGFSESSSMATSVITSVINILATFVGIALIDRVGRRGLLLAGSIGMAAGLATMAVSFGVAPTVNGRPDLGSVAGPLTLVAANVFVIFYGFSWGPAVWVLLGEMFNNRIRGTALAVAAAAQWLANFVVTTTFPSLSSLSLAVAYGLYTAFAVVSFAFVRLAVPETTGRTLEEM